MSLNDLPEITPSAVIALAEMGDHLIPFVIAMGRAIQDACEGECKDCACSTCMRIRAIDFMKG